MIFEIKKFFWENQALLKGWKVKDIDDIHVLIIASDWKKETGKSIFAIFAHQQNCPHFILSMMHDENYDSNLETEYQNLHFVRNGVDEDVKSLIPSPIYLGKILNRLCLIQTAAPGCSLMVLVHGKYSRAKLTKSISMFQKLVDVLMLFEKSLSRISKKNSTTTLKLIVDELDFFINNQTGQKDLKKSVEKMKRQADSLQGNLPVPQNQHGDFWAGNVFVQNKKISGIIDWEMFEKVSIPFNDIFSLATHCSFWHGKPDSRNYLLNEFMMQFKSSWFSEQVAFWFSQYLCQHHLEAEILELMIPVILIKRANDMQKIIDKNSIRIQNTWKELLEFYLANQNDYLPLRVINRKKF